MVSAKANDESDSLVLGAIRSFARWKFGLSNEDAANNKIDYLDQKDEMRHKKAYVAYAVTFVVKASNVAIPNVEITFNGEVLKTNNQGTAVFYYVPGGIDQAYQVVKSGYLTQSSEIDVSDSMTVNITLIAG